MKKLSELYEELKTEREQFLSRAKEYAKVTLKQLMSKSELGESEAKTQQWTSLGAFGANHFANKVAQTLFPIGHNFFIPAPSEAEAKKMEEDGVTIDKLGRQMADLANKGLKMLDKVMDSQTRVEACKHLAIAGNVAFFYPEKKRAILISLRNYVCERSSDGDLVTFIWEQEKAFGKLSPENQKAYQGAKENRGKQIKPKDKVKIYTGIELLDSGKFRYRSEISGVEVFNQDIEEHKVPFDVLRWSKVSGESYGHSHVELVFDDLYSFKFLTKAVAKGMALMCDVKYMVKRGPINIQHLIESDTGEYVNGDIEDIGVLQLGRFADYSQPQAMREEYRRSIGQAFLMNSAVRRDAERVTTYELRLDAAELESAQAGVYSLLAEEWQKPLARRILARLSPKFAGTSDPGIVTGLATLGRAGEMDKIAQFSQLVGITAQWPAAVQERIKWGAYLNTATASISLDVPWLMSDDEYKKASEERAKAAQQEEMNRGLAQSIPTAIQPIAQAAMGEGGQ